MSENNSIKLVGRVFVTFNIEAVTGLHIGGSDTGIEIGGVENTVIRDSLTDRPYIPGSSLKGKMRSLLEKSKGKKKNFPRNRPAFHVCQSSEEYSDCDVCHVFGVSGEQSFATPTRIVVRDTFMSEASAKRLQDAHTGLPFTEIKTEVSIDRVTSEANPRPLERVPAGTIFGKSVIEENGTKHEVGNPAELVYNLYDGAGCSVQKDIEWLELIREGLQLLEDDYLGGSGSRGSGKVKLHGIQVKFRKDPTNKVTDLEKDFPTFEDFSAGLEDFRTQIAGNY